MRKILGWAVLLETCSLLSAARLPIKTYTTSDGLARDHILCIVQDSRGFIWFCTAEGLSRFDGYQFANYHTEQGLPSNVVEDFVETRQGSYWVATAGGLCAFEPAGAGPSRFHCLPITGAHAIPPVSALYADSTGGVWAGTNALFHRGPKDTAFARVDLPLLPDTQITSIVMDRRGTLWAGASTGLYRRDCDGATRIYTKSDGLPNDFVMALAESPDGHLWIGTRLGLVRLDDVAAPGASLAPPPRFRVFSTNDGLPAHRIESLLFTSDGRLWVGTAEGIAEHIETKSRAGAQEFRSYSLAQGLTARAVGALAEDRDGNLWMGTFGSGAMKVAHSGFLTFSESDGVPAVGAILESRQGELCILSRAESDLTISRFDGRRFSSIRPAWPKHINYYGWGRGSIAVHNLDREWWIATGQGLVRFPPVTHVEQLASLRPKAVYTSRDGLPGDGIFQLFEDSRGDIWIGTIGPNTEDGLARWRRSSGAIGAFFGRHGLPDRPVPTSFAEDRAGNVWFGLFHGGLARYRAGTDTFTTFTSDDGIAGGVRNLFPDSTGRLWIGTTRGLIRIDDPNSERPRFVTYTTSDGLSSNFVSAVTEDHAGRIYATTGRGIDRFAPEPSSPGRIKHFTTADGIAPGELDLAYRDKHGALWFSTPLGVSQFIPSDDEPRPPPPVLLAGLSLGGITQPVSELGQSAISGLQLRQTPLRVDFVGLDFSPGGTLRYQYMLEGAETAWNPPTDQRAVVYASLAAGSYRFLVRAVASDGTVSPQPAALSFTILPPVWRSWWFLSICGLAAVLAAITFHRYRLIQHLAVANVRTRIATDLHDDIGASLSQIAILSEVAQRTAGSDDVQTRNTLTGIGEISRELVDSMSDIVWAINPDHDRLSNLVYRMRRFSTDLLQSRKVALQFRSTIADQDLRIGAQVRRESYLIFKEGVHNIVRHSGAGSVEVDLDFVNNCFSLRLHDNGKGFDPSSNYEGRGLANMRKRATALGGKLDFQSHPGSTTLIFTAPLNRSGPW